MTKNGTDFDAKSAQLAEAIRDASARSAGSKDPQRDRFRAKLFAELEALLPVAIQQAKKGKPALLRLLTRYTR